MKPLFVPYTRIFDPSTQEELDQAKAKLLVRPFDYARTLEGEGKSRRNYEQFTCTGFCQGVVKRIYKGNARFYACRKCVNRINKTSYLSGNRPDLAARQKDWRNKNYERYRSYVDKADKEKRRLNNQRSQLRRYKEDPHFRLQNILRTRLRSALLAQCSLEKKSKPTLDLVGCSISTLKEHLESQFVEGMSWDNYGLTGWHIDHIRPCASFDLTDPEQQKQCFHYTNLQPLWANDNLSKGAKWPIAA